MITRTKKQEGFSVIEMIVAVAVFAVALTVSLTGFLNVSNIQKKAESFRTINDNLNFTLETITRDIRTGSEYYLYSPSEIEFKSGENKGIIYRLSGSGQIERKIVDETDFLALTAPELKITKLLFDVRGVGLGDGLQPLVIILIKGTAGEEKGKSEFNLQTTVSQRKEEL